MSIARVVVTGATGFIGSRLCEELVAQGVIVYAIVRANSPQRNRLPAHPGLVVIEGDLSNIDAWGRDLTNMEGGFDCFYHLAWEGVSNPYRNNEVQFRNLDSLIATIKLAKTLGCRQWIGTGSQAEYGPHNKPISEEDLTQPTTLYGAAKLAAAYTSAIVGRQLGVSCQWVRIFSTYGPGDSAGWMIVDVIGQLLDGRKPALTLGEQRWDYLHVKDAVEALIALGKSDVVGSDIYNLGSGSSRTIREIVELVRDMINQDLEIGFGEVPYRPDQVMHLEANIDKLSHRIGWKPMIDLVTGLRQTVEYIRQSRKP